MFQHLFVSPHFDDAVGSCGGLIARLLYAGQTARILTVFGGLEREPFSMPARVLHDEWGLDRPVHDRRAEDTSACAVLGCAGSFLEFPDAIYRVGAGGQHLYPTFESLRGSIAPEDDHLAAQVAAEVAGGADESTIVYCALAVGAHVDHTVVRDCGGILMTLGVTVVFYRDFYYDRESDAAACSLTFRRVDVTLTHGEVAKKIAAFSEYRSQISDLFGSQEGMAAYFGGTGGTESILLPQTTSQTNFAMLRRVLDSETPL